MKAMKRLVLAAAAALATVAVSQISGCQRLALLTAPEKTPLSSDSALAEKAIGSFWNALHEGAYEQLPQVTELLTAAYLEHPRDPEVALLLGHAHLWQLSERVRAPRRATITEHAVLAEKFFSEAHRLDPEDHRILGWLGGVQMAVGGIHQDERKRREGYFTVKEGVEKFPEFNEFSLSFAMAGLPRRHERFSEVVEAMWRNADVCAGAPLDRKNPQYLLAVDQAVYEGPARVCWNSAKAPHNFEGFWLHFGDVLVKQGDWETARIIYANARLSPDYGRWPYSGVLEQRIQDAPQNAERFLDEDGGNDPLIMQGSTIACTGCHQSRN